MADSKQRRWQLNDDSVLVTHHEERLRIVPPDLWNAVKVRQGEKVAEIEQLRGLMKAGSLSQTVALAAM